MPWHQKMLHYRFAYFFARYMPEITSCLSRKKKNPYHESYLSAIFDCQREELTSGHPVIEIIGQAENHPYRSE